MRNIESALLAQLGLKVDHRKISIAQTAEVRPIEALERDAVRDRMLQRALLFENMSVAPGKRPHRIAITVTLSFRGQTETAEEEASDTPRSRVEGAAKASVTVIDRLLTDFSIALEGAKIVEAFDREFAFVAVQGLGGRETSLLTGTAEIKESAERAAVFAVLDATNRWTEARRPARRAGGGGAGALTHPCFWTDTSDEDWTGRLAPGGRARHSEEVSRAVDGEPAGHTHHGKEHKVRGSRSLQDSRCGQRAQRRLAEKTD